MGPTAAGKTCIAATLAERGPFEIVSVDSALVFRHLDIGTGKPGREVLGRAPHRLIDIRDPDERYSAGEFRDDALGAIADIRASGRIPLLTGGTGLYFRALEQGLAALPAADPAVRTEIEREATRIGWPAMHARLAGLDPASAQRIHPNDPQRIERALEVHAVAGRPMSELLARGRRGGLAGTVCRIVIEPADRSVLHQGIADRFVRMLDAGLIDEVRDLRRRWPLTERSASMRLVGYRQVWAYLEGKCSREEMTARAIAATRQLARRQLTWLRSDPAAVRIDCHAPDAAERVAEYAESFVERAGGMPSS
ncbi:MAG: tRNA (adenosine(37)-N6)-dimethylallyltransferase MiaA [Gammaproteobacteria bacterium]|nr:tRNA (adenosine(37)-N6)-dimethylallyltransferase MiaA [Gammaproteobacteria bacterium]